MELEDEILLNLYCSRTSQVTFLEERVAASATPSCRRYIRTSGLPYRQLRIKLSTLITSPLAQPYTACHRYDCVHVLLQRLILSCIFKIQRSAEVRPGIRGKLSVSPGVPRRGTTEIVYWYSQYPRQKLHVIEVSRESIFLNACEVRHKEIMPCSPSNSCLSRTS